MLEIIEKGGHLMWLLLGCSVFAMAVAAERFLYYHRASINVSLLLEGIGRRLRRKEYAEAVRECLGTPGPVARVVHAAVLHHDAPRAELKEIVQEAGQLEVQRLERYLPVLSTIAFVAPLIGLLGTILGMTDTFIQVSEVSGYASPFQLFRGVYQSLVTSAAGLVVAVPVFIMYSFLASNVRSLMREMERAGIEVVNLISESKRDREILSFSDERSEVADEKGQKGAHKKG
ncbi:MotA/TolQ/ExbB proton channel family protein [Sulfuriroseicoccus oceanibius]|uniref:MotA/TolQ/ExbB proton channel family protein n=1 Tax=Sulfuriroseicoccus oceanibius TaxID=2707525 RepID=A0A6B3L801_9BACT|nr:MotA/TolQ/ExbB proton channel family protein [Sulfuriroseicoccus oceanibius]QQL46303.1 MotA/TolQ/ExbB proton channel family protein [Sulfuriroseicoccus oceanibius]